MQEAIRERHIGIDLLQPALRLPRIRSSFQHGAEGHGHLDHIALLGRQPQRADPCLLEEVLIVERLHGKAVWILPADKAAVVLGDGLFFPAEGHVEPRRVLPALHQRIIDAGGVIKFNTDVKGDDLAGLIIDCSGASARENDPELRTVKGEMALVETSEVSLTRPVRLLHPRWPLYVIPRDDNLFMPGATSLETDSDGVSLRSALDLLVAAYSVHPAFEGAHLVEFGWGLRPAYPDNLPRITLGSNDRVRVNGLYRHGFLIAPALAQATLNYVRHGQLDNELMRRA
jgi:glycine oxidase